MISSIRPLTPKEPIPAWHAAFEVMLPDIERHADYALRYLTPEAREDAVEEVVAYACVTFARLARQSKTHRAFPSTLAIQGVRRYRQGRRVGARTASRDVMSPMRRNNGTVVEPLSPWDKRRDRWLDVVVENRQAGPAETAAARIDIGEWFGRMPPRRRKIAEALMVGNSTGEVARQFGVSASRISELRDVLRQSWEEFQGGVSDV